MKVKTSTTAETTEGSLPTKEEEVKITSDKKITDKKETKKSENLK